MRRNQIPRNFFKVVSGFAISCSILDHTGQYEVALFVLSFCPYLPYPLGTLVHRVLAYRGCSKQVFTLIFTVGCLGELHIGKCRSVLHGRGGNDSFSLRFFTESLQPPGTEEARVAMTEGSWVFPGVVVEASNSPGWPLDAPCGQGKPASTWHLPASPAIPKNQQGEFLLFYRCICCVTAVRYPACFSCLFCCDFKLCTSCLSETLHSSSGF